MKNTFFLNSPLLSIIIPMYNCATVIVRCLDSIDYQDCEIIVVNDGSHDNGAEIVKQYAATHPNVRLINKTNGGVSSARNLGIGEAKGKYIMFLDADDFVASNGISRLLDMAISSNADILKYKINHIKRGQDIITNLENFSIKSRHIVGRGEAMKYFDISDYHVVDALFKRSVIINNEIHFPEDLHLREDDVFMCAIYCVSTEVVVVDLPLYQYIVDSPNSSTDNPNVKPYRLLVDSNLKAIQYRRNIISSNFMDDYFPLEKYKYMRYVYAMERMMLQGKYSYYEYVNVLKEAQKMNCWPLLYKWIGVAQFDFSIKNIIKTFLCNHPFIHYYLFKCLKI